jgi:hypothetical protein
LRLALVRRPRNQFLEVRRQPGQSHHSPTSS